MSIIPTIPTFRPQLCNNTVGWMRITVCFVVVSAMHPGAAQASALARIWRKPVVQDVQVLNLASQADSSDAPARMRAALLSVHAHVERQRALATLLRDVVPVPISRTADILLSDDTDIGRSRQRRSGIRFLSLAADDRVPDDVRQEAKVASVRLLSAREVQHVFEQLHVHVRSRGPTGACQEETPEEIEDAVGELVDPTELQGCGWTEPVSRLYLRPNVIHLNVDVDILQQDLDHAAEGLDPQEWDHCTTLWKETHLCKLKNDGTPEDDGKGGCVADSTISNGSDYKTPRRMYEHFVCDNSLCSIELFLDSRVVYPFERQDKYLMWYNNPQNISGPHVHPDQGDVVMEKLQQGKIAVKSRKTFGFDTFVNAAVAYMMLRSIETGHYLVDLACCHR